jgi:hypothetical protein
MADTKYLEALIEAIKFVYERSDGYFKTTEGRERSMVFRIAHHLAHNIENKEVFVDIEPTRCERKTKRDSGRRGAGFFGEGTGEDHHERYCPSGWYQCGRSLQVL